MTGTRSAAASMVLARIAVVIGSLVVAMLMMTPTASAEEGWPDASGEHDRWYNGCSAPLTGDAPGGFIFRDACNWHDLCYGGHIAGHTRESCDETFHQFMDTICYYNYGNSEACRAWSVAYYLGVRSFGGWYYLPPPPPPCDDDPPPQI
ncbi:MAG: phospholipase [Sporichthyaceae bacterium]|nr:phospholipase [Sporichthyaceae bacterium]